MVSTVMDLLQIPSPSHQCGQRIIVDGRHFLLQLFKLHKFSKASSFCRFLSFGYPIPYRPVEDLAFAVARFFEKGGTFQNYYMVVQTCYLSSFLSLFFLQGFSSIISSQYFGGTNFGRTAGGPLIATSYDYDAPLDEYGKNSIIDFNNWF